MEVEKRREKKEKKNRKTEELDTRTLPTFFTGVAWNSVSNAKGGKGGGIIQN